MASEQNILGVLKIAVDSGDLKNVSTALKGVDSLEILMRASAMTSLYRGEGGASRSVEMNSVIQARMAQLQASKR